MQLIFGKSGRKIPETYNAETDLIIYRHGMKDCPMARGRWTREKFVLKAGSLVMEIANFQSCKPGIVDFKNHLIQNKVLILNEGCGDYVLQEDIYFYSPSAAGELVQGHTSNGFVDWKNVDGVNFGHLVWPEDPLYFS